MAAVPPTPTHPANRPATGDDHDRFLASGGGPASVRPLVAASWRRSMAAGIDSEHGRAPSVMNAEELDEYRFAHALSRVFPLLYDVLGRAAEECDSLMAVGDADGRLLWVSGPPALLSRAETINFAAGAAWDEAHAGTNAPGTALQLGVPVQIRSAEHFSRSVQAWTCVAAPIHDPTTSAVLGIVDVTGTDAVASPQTMGLVRAAARLAEAELGRLAAVDVRGLWTPVAETATASALGRPDVQIEVHRRVVRLSQRHGEILVLLSTRPEGLTGEQLAVELYREDVGLSTVRAELTRLRSLLGHDLLDSRPYRLARPIEADWLHVGDLLDRGEIAAALHEYHGPLLPGSDAPGVVDLRQRLERRLRAAILGLGSVDLMAAWTRTRWGADDLPMWSRIAAGPAGPALRSIARVEVDRLEAEFGGARLARVAQGPARSHAAFLQRPPS